MLCRQAVCPVERGYGYDHGEALRSSLRARKEIKLENAQTDPELIAVTP